MSARGARPRVKRSVVRRVLWSYAFVVAAFAVVAGWSALALRSAAREASLMRAGYYPLALAVRDLVAKQDTYNSQLNHITAARNPADLRVWFDFALRIGRPKLFGEVRTAIGRAFLASGDPDTRRVGSELLAEVGAIERLFKDDGERLSRLFSALERGDSALAERLRDEAVTRGSQGSTRLGRLELRVEREVDLLLDQARFRERFALKLLILLSTIGLLVGLLMALYTRRVLLPLGLVTERAKAVASGDLEPRKPIVSGDEIGALSATFEGMVEAIARANEQLVATERLATVGKMAAHVTHEIRNPLSSIALNLELLEEELRPDADEARALVRAISGEVERLSSLSQQYLAFARQRSSTVALEELGDVVRGACDFSRRELEKAAIQLELDIDGQLGSMPVDEGQIKQALFNLLRNAREAMPDGGTISVRVRRTTAGAEVVIEDEGAGIEPEHRARLFEPFFTTKSHGSGLGLAITRQVVAAHGGTIEIEARSPRGTRVILRLPRRDRFPTTLPSRTAPDSTVRPATARTSEPGAPPRLHGEPLDD
ncbi:MAG TPA: ATP-binding protein [Polyangiaceae bacterium]|nr:ATP-binding protein [Polyangiaceae bacterium]